MEEKQPEIQSTKLSDLPPSSDADFWLDAEIHTGIGTTSQKEIEKQVEEERAKHYFVKVTGRQAQCTHCDWGFELDPGDKVIDGHLYDKKKQLVI